MSVLKATERRGGEEAGSGPPVCSAEQRGGHGQPAGAPRTPGSPEAGARSSPTPRSKATAEEAALASRRALSAHIGWVPGAWEPHWA